MHSERRAKNTITSELSLSPNNLSYCLQKSCSTGIRLCTSKSRALLNHSEQGRSKNSFPCCKDRMRGNLQILTTILRYILDSGLLNNTMLCHPLARHAPHGHQDAIKRLIMPLEIYVTSNYEIKVCIMIVLSITIGKVDMFMIIS